MSPDVFSSCIRKINSLKPHSKQKQYNQRHFHVKVFVNTYVLWNSQELTAKLKLLPIQSDSKHAFLEASSTAFK